MTKQDHLEDKNVVAVIDAFFGDNGKGKVSDYLASLKIDGNNLFDYTYRPNGGTNTGHTVVINSVKYVFHLVPSASLVPNMTSFIGRSVLFEPKTYFSERKIVEANNPTSRIWIDSNAHVIMPWHILLDNLREVVDSERNIGTTGKGVGPCQETKASRKGFVRVETLLNKEELEYRVKESLRIRGPELYDLINRFNDNKILVEKYVNVETYISSIKLADESNLMEFFSENKINADIVVNKYLELGKKLESDVKEDSAAMLREQVRNNNKKVIVEGAQGVFLDEDDGTYPNSTAGRTTRSGLEAAAGLDFDLVYNVIKAYGTRVGSGPFITELHGDIADALRKAGNEYGATTGRPRRVGWLDAPALKYAFELNSRRNEEKLVVMNKLDVLAGFDPLIIIDYKLPIVDNTFEPIYKYIPSEVDRLKIGRSIYNGTIESIKDAKNFKDLPINAANYVRTVEELTDCKIRMLGTGHGRDDIIFE